MLVAAQVQRLAQVAAALADAVTPEQVAEAIVEQGLVGAGAHAGAVLRLSADGSHLKILHARGFSREQLEQYDSIALDAAVPVAEVARSAEPVFLGSGELREAAYPGITALSHSRAWAALPLHARGRILGALALSFDRPQQFDPDERSFLLAMAQQCALALDRALLLDEQQSAAAELRALVGALRRRDLQLGLAQRAAAAGVWEFDPATGVAGVSPELDALLELGANGAPITFGEWVERVHPEDLARVRAAIESGQREIDIEFRYEHPRLGTRRLTAIGRLIADDGRAPRLHGLTMDVTARYDAEDRLLRQREHTRMVADAAGLGIWTWDVVADTSEWDETAARIFGLSPGVPVDREYFLSRLHPDDRAPVRRRLDAAMASRDSYQDEYRVVLPSGEVRWVADYARIIRDEDGRPVWLGGVMLDVTERRAADEQQRQMQRIESIGRLAGGMAHEINNMMSVVLGFAEFVLRHPAIPPDARGDLLEIQRAAERAASITRQVLAFSRRQVLHPELLDLNAVVAEGHAMLRRLLGEDIDLVLDLAPVGGTVRADRNQLIQALVNLAINAREAMPAGGRLIIRTSHRRLAADDLQPFIGADARPGEYVSLTVADTGTGMTPEVLARAFEPFFTTRPVGQGTGLGLSTVYGIVKQSDGYVWAESEPGQGTTVSVLLPLAETAAVVEPAAPPAVTGLRGSGTVLVVEDEPLVRLMARRTLEELGYDVAEACDGDAALAEVSARGEEFVLVITDVIMPGMSGRELGVRIGQVRPALPILFVSGHPSEFVIENGLLDEGQAFLQKPFLPDVLGAAVRSLLDTVRR